MFFSRFFKKKQQEKIPDATENIDYITLFNAIRIELNNYNQGNGMRAGAPETTKNDFKTRILTIATNAISEQPAATNNIINEVISLSMHLSDTFGN